LIVKLLPDVLQKVAFYDAKDGLSACKRPPFATPLTAFCGTVGHKQITDKPPGDMP
jgi:hypothetical protein